MTTSYLEILKVVGKQSKIFFIYVDSFIEVDNK